MDRPTPWDESQVKQVRSLLTKFCNDESTVCAVMDCRKKDLNWLCRQAFGLTFRDAAKKFELEGKAILKMAYFDAAVDDKNSKALDLMAREYLDMLGPVEHRRKVKAETEAKAEQAKVEEVDF